MRIPLIICVILIAVTVKAQELNRKYLADLYPAAAGEVYQVQLFEDNIWFVDEQGSVCYFNGLAMHCYANEELGMTAIYKHLHSAHGLIQLYDGPLRAYATWKNGTWTHHNQPIPERYISPDGIFQDSLEQWRRFLWTGQEYETIDQEIVLKLLKDLGYQDKEIGARDCGIITAKNMENHIVHSSNNILNGAISVGKAFYQLASGEYVFLDNHCKIHKTEMSYDHIINSNQCKSDGLIAVNGNRPEIISIQENKSIAFLEDDIIGQFDKNEQYYYTASHNGLTFNTQGIRFFESGQDGMVNASHVAAEDHNRNIWFGGYKTGLSNFDGNTLQKMPLQNSRLDNFMHGSIKLDQSLIMLTEQYNELVVIENGKVAHWQVKTKNPFLAYDVTELSNGMLAFGTFKSGLGLVNKEKLFSDSIRQIHHDNNISLKQIFCLKEDSKNRIWMASQTEGISIYDPKSKQAKSFLVKDYPEKRFGLTALHFDDQNNLWLGTFNGLKIIKDADQVDFTQVDPYTLMEDVELFPNEGNTTALIQKDSLLVVAAEHAVWFIDLPSFYKDPKGFDAYSYSYQYDLQGRTSEENGAMIDSEGQIWIGTQEGYLSFNLEDMSFDTTTIDIYLDSYKIADSTYSLNSSTIYLPPENRNFSYNFNVRSNPSLRHNFYIQNTLIDNTGKEVLSEIQDPIQSQNRLFLEPGDYQLVSSVYKNNRLIDQDTYTIIAESYLTEKPWFWPLIIGIVSLGIILFIRFRNEKIKSLLQKDLDLQKLKQKQKQTQIQAIVSSFNPHFINNSLQWVQSKYNHDPDLVKVTGRLSENMEHILLKSKAGVAYHTLQEELKLVQNYVTIQLIRSKNSFSFNQSKQIDHLMDIHLPIMQLQIHVENALEHGLMNRSDSCYISLNIEEEDNAVIFSIEDDGAGRTKAKELGSQGTQAGVNMLAKLHHIINGQNKDQITQRYEDDIFGEHGTRVIIRIPKVMNYEI